MDEIFKISDEITVLRDGKYIGTVLAKDAKIDQLIKMMTGREFKDIYPPRVRNISNDVYFRIRNLSCKDYFEDVNLELKKGEILGIFGMVGAGRSEVAKTIFGIMKRNSGDIEIDDRMVEINCPHDAIKNGIAFVTEDRRKEGLVLINSVKVNITMVSLANIMSKLGFLNTEKENNIANNAVTKLRIKVTSIDQKVNKLSGGNQQKVVLAKWLEIRPKILILDEPTRGIDVGAKYEIYQIIRRLSEQGIGIILISSELPEVLGMSDRIIVMRDGKIVREFKTGDTSQEEIIMYATGGNNNG
jgi:ribose transport system ATP-binding protein